MSEFLQTVLKGLYPPYLFFVALGMLLRIRNHEWRKRDSFLLAVFLLYECFAAFQVFLFYGELSTSKRYLQVALPLYLPFATLGIQAFYRWMEHWKWGRWAKVMLAAVFIGSLLNVYAYLAKERRPGKRRVKRLASFAAAAAIREDWKVSPPLLLLKCDQYQPGRRPIVLAEGPQDGYLSGGQGYNGDFYQPLGILPDYAVLLTPLDDPNYALIKECSVDTQSVFVYRRENRSSF